MWDPKYENTMDPSAFRKATRKGELNTDSTRAEMPGFFLKNGWIISAIIHRIYYKSNPKHRFNQAALRNYLMNRFLYPSVTDGIQREISDQK